MTVVDRAGGTGNNNRTPHVIPIGELFGNADISRVTITRHAIEEAQNKFGIPQKKAEGWIRRRLAESQYIGEIMNEEGNLTRLFAIHRTCLILDRERDAVITVYRRKRTTSRLAAPIRQLIEKEIRKDRRKISALEKRTKLDKADIRVEIAQLERRKVRTKSENVRMACEARINALNEQLTILDEDLRKAKLEYSTLLKDVTAYV